MAYQNFTLSRRIIGILVVYFAVAFFAISMTLRVSTSADGSAEVGRLQAFRLAYLVTHLSREVAERESVVAEVVKEMARFETLLARLQRSNLFRLPIPLFSPSPEDDVMTGVRDLLGYWQAEVKPLVVEAAAVLPMADPMGWQTRFQQKFEGMVPRLDTLIKHVESRDSNAAAMLHSLQLGLLMLALVGTAILILWFHLMVLRPVSRLREGIRRMTGADFSVRLQLERRDEFGELADGFNRMAEQLEDLYTTLEQRVEEKTRGIAERTYSLANQNRELSTLYEIAAFLNESVYVEDVCRGFLKRVMSSTGASGGAVRLIDADTNELRLVAHEGVSQEFSDKEATLGFGECLCGDAARRGVPLIWSGQQSDPAPSRGDCKAVNFCGTAVFTIRHQKFTVGVFNLFSEDARAYSEREILLLETLGQHLGLAIENLRLVARAREMAVSEERNILAQELHDSIAQSLAFLNIQAQMLGEALQQRNTVDAQENLTHMREGIQQSYDHVRELLVHFRTRMPQGDLGNALRDTLEKFEGQTGVSTYIKGDEGELSMPPNVGMQVLHIVQEALSNVRKHSGAKNVYIETAHGPDTQSIIVKDDGRGFDSEGEPPGIEHMGLQVMRDRTRRIGGRIKIHSTPGNGVEVRLDLMKYDSKPTRRHDDRSYSAH